MHELLAELGKGEFDTTFLARCQNRDRLVVLKVLTKKPGYEHALTRFETERMIHAYVGVHPRILQLYDVGSDQDRTWFSMEFADRGNLAKCSGKPWCASEAAVVIESVSRGLEYLHSRGILYSSLRAGNIFLMNDGRALLGRFRMARACFSRDDLTEGTASNLRDLGAILYSMLTMSRPNSGALSCLPNTIPPKLAAICKVCLREHESRIYTSAGQMADDLMRFLQEQTKVSEQGKSMGTRTDSE